MSGLIINPYAYGSGGGGSLPADTINAVFIEDMTFSGGYFTGFGSDQVSGATLIGTTNTGSGSLGDATNGIDNGNINTTNYWTVDQASLAGDGSVNWLMFFSDKAAWTAGVIADSNTANYLGAAESGSGASTVFNTTYQGVVGRGGTVGSSASVTRDQLWTAAFSTSDTLKYVAVRQPTFPATARRLLMYPGGGGSNPPAYSPNVYFKGLVVFPSGSWGNVQDYIDYGLAKLA